ncbi:DUF305 domain-containing protein [Streptomyces sp. NBC_01304]|uniref:DUF305 domain-containing protein n=1 Tax=Streptomyces sp. NBC_01304 TaxID=2903818 RepID=UPI002E1253C8|nr:DUF305 domain-containing protein [Streptomyces sp. NBC_01304]
MRHAGLLSACAAAVLLAAGGGVALGLADDSGSKPAPAKSASPAADSVDAGFARDMAVHHQQAVEMSFVVRDRTDDEDVRRLAYDIANTQANQRGMLIGWLDLWELPKASPAQPPMSWMGMAPSEDPGGSGVLMPGMATKAEIARLSKARGKEAEILYLQLMTDHHKGGIHMAEYCGEHCEVPTERRLAAGMAAAQESELGLMADLLKERGAAPR